MVYGINIVSTPIYGNLLLTAALQRLVWWILLWLYSVCIEQVPWLAAHYLRYVNATGAVSLKQITIDSSALISSICSSRPTIGETEYLGLLWISVNCLNSFVKGTYKPRSLNSAEKNMGAMSIYKLEDYILIIQNDFWIVNEIREIGFNLYFVFAHIIR